MSGPSDEEIENERAIRHLELIEEQASSLESIARSLARIAETFEGLLDVARARAKEGK